MVESGDMVERVKKALLRGAALTLKATPLWMEAIGVGAFISDVVARHPAFSVKLRELDGKVFLFEAIDIGKGFYLYVKDGGIRVLVHRSGEPDVRMRGEMKVLMDVFLGKVDPDTVFFSRRLEITGDTAAAIHLKNILASLA